MIVKLGAGLDHALARNAVHRYGLRFLDDVPHKNPVRANLDDTFVGEVIPTCDSEDGWNA